MQKKIELVQRVEFIKKISAGKKVLHLGCTNFPYTKDSIENGILLHFDLEKTAKELYGFDFDQEGIDILAKAGAKNLFRADLEKLEEVPLNETFDVIIAGEMIEHLNNPRTFFAGNSAIYECGNEPCNYDDKRLFRPQIFDLRTARKRRRKRAGAS